MKPYHEPIPGERTGVTTARLVDEHGAMVARGLRPNETQFAVFANGAVFSSSYWPGAAAGDPAPGVHMAGDAAWLPWSRVACSDFSQIERVLGFQFDRQVPA